MVVYEVENTACNTKAQVIENGDKYLMCFVEADTNYKISCPLEFTDERSAKLCAEEVL